MFGLSFVFSQLFFVFSTSTVIPMSTEFFCDDNTRYNDIVDLPDLGFDEIDAGNTNLCSGFIENELCVPQDSLDDIEWYPNFTDDLISWNYLCWSPKQEHKLGFPITPEQTNETHVQDKTRVSSNGEYCAIVAHNKRKQRSKRSQKQHVWSTKNVDFGRGNDNDDDEEVSYVNRNNSYSKVLKKRTCTHCMTDTTPQWRMGPKGPNTLCNACGVRYKSGRLVPEYRPANSPTFDSLKHSNFHKKITKRREKRFSPKQ